VIERRLGNAAGEIRESRWYDYIIVNDVFSRAVEELKSVIVAERCGHAGCWRRWLKFLIFVKSEE